MNFNIYSSVLILGAVISAITAYMSWRRRPTAGATSLAILMICITQWTICQLLYILNTSHTVKHFWYDLRYIGVVIAPVAFLTLVAEYTNRKKFYSKNFLILSSIIPIITLIMIITNKYHGLFRESFVFKNINGIEIITAEPGKWFWIHTWYSYLLLFKGLLFILLILNHLQIEYRIQAVILVSGAVIPWIYNVIYVYYLRKVIFIDITPLAFCLTGIIFFWGLFHFKLFDLSPIAKELVFESIEDIVIILDNQMRIVDINLPAKKYFKAEDNKIIGKLIYEILPEWTKVYNEDSREKKNEINTLVLNKEDYFEFKNTLIYDKGKRKVGYLIILHDITERENIMAEIEASRKKAEAANKSKSIFLANMSHEIRTPMNGILGMIDLMLYSELEKEQKENIGIIKDSAESLLSIINDILDYSKIESGKMELELIDFNVKELIENSVKMFTFRANKKGIELICNIDKGIPDILSGDSLRLRQIINNLINNAVKFTLEGFVKIEVKIVNKLNNKLVLSFIVSDTGIGIPQEKINNLFKSFEQIDCSTTRLYGGTGLGLTIVKNLVELMKGSIKVESEINTGSSFIVEIPLIVSDKIKKPDKLNPKVQTNLFDNKKINILLAEDNKVNQMIMKKILKKNGLNVEVAENGKIVLKKLEEKSFDIIFMDIQMPILDGYETTIKIRERNINTPIIALTANAMKSDRKKCLKSGMNDYLSKPIIYDKLFELINKYT